MFLSKLESFRGAAMQRRFRRTCPVCGRPDLKESLHIFYKFTACLPRRENPILSKPRCHHGSPASKGLRICRVNIRHPQKHQEQQRVRHLWQPNPVRNSTSAINSHFWFWILHKVEKTYFVQQILKHNRIVYEQQKSIRIFWYYNQWQECYEELKTSLEKSIRFERGVPELSENLSEINAPYNNIIILDDLMAEATDSPMVSRLFTQGRHRNASVILLLQNMFPKGKYNTDISRNAQYLALFRSPSDQKQIGIIAERMFDKNRVHFMNAYYKETEKPYGYLLVDNKPDTPADQQIFADLFGECYAYHLGVSSTEPTRVETKPVGKHSTTTKTTSSRNKPVQTITWSNVPNDVWYKHTWGAPAVRKIPEGYVIIEMYNTSCNTSHQPVRAVEINGENYWPVKLKHRSTGHTKWLNLHSDEPTVQCIVKETKENTTGPNACNEIAISQ